MRKYIFLFFLFLLFCINCFSQNIFFNPNNFSLSDKSSSSGVNNDSDNFINIYQYSFIKSQVNQYKNIGAPHEVRSLKNNFFNIGFNAFEYNIKADVFLPHMNSTYSSQLKYLNGTRKEQIISIIHEQKLLKVSNGGVSYRGIVSPGFYKQQFNNFKNFASYLKFNSLNNKYDAAAYYFSNKIIADENGGIVSDTLLKIYRGQELSIPVYLNNAEHRLRSKGYAFHHNYNFSGQLDDSLKNDSIPARFIGFDHTLEISKQSFVYYESSIDSGYYLNNFFSESSTYDSLAFKKVSNQLNFTVANASAFNGNGKILFNSKFGFDINSFKSRLHIYDTSFNNNSANAMIRLVNRNKWNVSASYKKLIEKKNTKPFIFETLMAYRINNVFSRVGFEYRNQIIPPDFISEVYYSNHFIWSNDFKNGKDIIHKGFVSLFSNQITLSAWKHSIEGHVFYDEDFKLPHQNNSKIELYKGSVNIKYQIGNWHLASDNIFNFSSTIGLIRFPQYDLSNTIYYQNYFFKKALLASIGTHVHYQSAWYANGYNPATGQFYLQNNVKIGDYPYFDVFLDMTIKSATIFLKVEHLNAGIGEYRYFYMPHYPTPPRTFKFGISWNFKD